MTQPVRPVYPAPPRSGPPKSGEAVKQTKGRKVLPPTLTASHRSALDRLHKWAGSRSHHASAPDFAVTAKEMLDVLRQGVAFDAAWIVQLNPQNFHFLKVYLQRFSRAAFAEYLRAFQTTVPTPLQMKASGLVSQRGGRLIDKKRGRSGLFYETILQPLGLDRFLIGACIDSGKKHVGSICLWRSPKQRDFSDSDTLFLERTSNDFAALLRRKRPRQRSSNKRKAVPILNPPPSPGIFVLGNQNEVVFMNEEARALLSLIDKSGSPEEASEQPFFLRLRRIREEIVQHPFRSASERLKTGNGSTSLNHLFAFRGISFSCRGTLLDGGPANTNLVLVLVETEKEQGNSLSQSDLSSAREKYQGGEFGLTEQEEAVAGLISRGLTNKGAASELGISVYTIKGHVKRIMKKFGVNTRAAITTKIMTQ